MATSSPSSTPSDFAFFGVCRSVAAGVNLRPEGRRFFVFVFVFGIRRDPISGLKFYA
ncbi:MAG TPA: hypothetical protein VGB82_14990 [Alphaproteobacteria bacterium]